MLKPGKMNRRHSNIRSVMHWRCAGFFQKAHLRDDFVLRAAAVFVILAVLMAGCSWSKPKAEKTAEELAVDGQAYFEDEKYEKAISSYKKLKDWYPFSAHVKDAELKIADAHYRMEAYDEAILAYNAYERLHPNDEKVPYVIYQTGRCDFDRMETIKRDATATHQALMSFQRLVQQFPESEYAEKAADHINICRRHLAAKEMDIGRFYFKMEKYAAALDRFAGVVTAYPDLEVQQQALDEIAKCRAAMEAEAAREQAESESGDAASVESSETPELPETATPPEKPAPVPE